jgi:hypothetical protein
MLRHQHQFRNCQLRLVLTTSLALGSVICGGMLGCSRGPAEEKSGASGHNDEKSVAEQYARAFAKHQDATTNLRILVAEAASIADTFSQNEKTIEECQEKIAAIEERKPPVTEESKQRRERLIKEYQELIAAAQEHSAAMDKDLKELATKIELQKVRVRSLAEIRQQLSTEKVKQEF